MKYLEEKLRKRTDMAEVRHHELENKSGVTQNVAQRGKERGNMKEVETWRTELEQKKVQQSLRRRQYGEKRKDDI